MPIERAFTSADAIVTVSHNEAGYARRRGFQPTDRVLAIDNALPEAFLGQLLTLERPKTIGYCGSWVARKGTDLLVVEMTKVLREVPDWQLHLVGVGDGFRPESHFPPDVMPRIKVTGFIADKTEQRRVYQSWAIAVMPSLYESFGLVAAEAMSCGCALVASRTGFPAALSNGVEALILEEPRSPHLSSAALSLIADEALRRRIAEAGWERVQSLRWDDNIEKLESFYLHLVGQQRLNSTVHS
jgi:glycosyltransferase involved in cell wall biosynthesis